MINKNILIGIFALALLFAFSNAARAAEPATVGLTIGDVTLITANTTSTLGNPIIGGTNTGSTATAVIVWKDTSKQYNFTLHAIYYNTTPVVWSKASLASIAGNSTCKSSTTVRAMCNHTAATATVGGAMKVTMTLPSDVTNTHIRIQLNVTAAATSGGTPINRTFKVRAFDSTAPTLTLYPAEGYQYRNKNHTVNVTMVTSENASFAWIFMDGINYSRDHGTNGAHGLSRSTDYKTWSFSVVASEGLKTAYGGAHDYAWDGVNGAQSTVRSFSLNSGSSAAAKAVVAAQATTASNTNILIIVVIAGVVLYLWSKKK